ncbi:hypothetical protein I312_101147 [Cryptococcus bacillisporus CA1280]|uniref:uncharacterized protein n=1 Tax=Cryptococcus bacillisporus CA1280 TaxID=1296109 RepID=UPI00336843BD
MPSGAPSPPPLGPFGVGQIHLEFPGLGERETETLTEKLTGSGSQTRPQPGHLKHSSKERPLRRLVLPDD